MMKWKPIAGIAATCAAFAIALGAFLWVFGLDLWTDLPPWVLVVLPLGLAYLVAVVAGEYLVPGKQAAAIALVCLAVAAPLAWHYPGAPGARGEGGIR